MDCDLDLLKEDRELHTKVRWRLQQLVLKVLWKEQSLIINYDFLKYRSM